MAINRYTNVLDKENDELILGTGGAAWLPHFHDMGLVGHFLIPVLAPGPLYFMSPVSFIEKPIRWLETFTKYNCRISAAPNFAYQLCVKKISPEEKKSLDLSSWQVALTGSEPIRADVMDAFAAYFKDCGFNREAFSPCFGMAETTLIISGRDRLSGYETLKVDPVKLQANLVAESVDGQELVGCGYVDSGFDLCIVDPETGQKVSDAQIGEIWLAGPSLTDGYWNRPELNASQFNALLADGSGPYFKTGDLGFLKKDELYVTGRIKDMIILNGKNHYPQDIELTVGNNCMLLQSLRQVILVKILKK